jgi:hypothetical protein
MPMPRGEATPKIPFPAAVITRPCLRGTHGRAIIFFVRAAIFPPGLPTGARQVERVARKGSFLLRLVAGSSQTCHNRNNGAA